MFSTGANSSLEATGIVGEVLFPKTFVWRYGGSRVLVTGTFTRWADHVPMSPVEGCPTLFQATCRLAPGMHQYKFCVDGEWRHDEHEPSVSGSYGIVNILFVSREHDSLTAPLSPGTPGSGINMEVDHETFQHVGAGLGISDSDIETSRHCISGFLSSHTAYGLLPDSGKVIALDVNLPVKQAFHVLYEQGIPVAPLWDFNRGKFVGVLSPLDFILILRELGSHGSNLTEEQLETHTIAAWKSAKQQISRQFHPHSKSGQRSLVYAGPFDSLKDVALKILQNDVSTIPIIHSSAQDGFFPQLLHLASLSGILKCICRYFRHSSRCLPILHQPICSLAIGTWVPKIGESNTKTLAMLRPNASLSSALALLVQARVSSIPVVNDKDSLLDIYSKSDITALAKDKVYTHIQLDEMTVYQALQLGQDSNGFFGQRCQMCLGTDTLQKVMERLANPGVRRVVIVEAGSKRVEGIISLGDVFRFFLGSS
ncbi:sucrose nonfermenting 4-like protein isoform X1 [Phalaenopsis equestris]|uniref:sucrose nonfermenting 4-like protein isoform X1 n=2 Tax=Phalaenopsis equestris TaxID=78828 RepID=UPI0009E24795|nr:sucrose nonfermenting 4-like protein isoform X1 [Phalaenopsis equestris]